MEQCFIAVRIGVYIQSYKILIYAKEYSIVLEYKKDKDIRSEEYNVKEFRFEFYSIIIDAKMVINKRFQ